VVGDPAEELELRTMASASATAGGLMEKALAHGERVIDLAGELGRDDDRLRAIARQANILIEGYQQRAFELLNATLAEPGMEPGVPGYAEVATILAKAEMRVLNDVRAIELADQVLPVAQQAGNDQLVVDLLITRGVSLSNIGRSTEAVVILTGALDVAIRLGLSEQINRAAVNLGYAIAQDDPMRAFEVSRAAIDRARRDGVIWGIRYIVGNAVDSAIEVGEWDWALAIMGEMDALFTEAAERIWFGTFSGVIRAWRGEDVHGEVVALHEEARAFDDLQYRAIGAYGVAVSSMARGNLDDVIRISEEAMANGIAGLDGGVYGARAAIWKGDAARARRFRDRFAESSDARRATALVATMDGGIAALEGRAADARAHFADAQRQWRELGCQLWLAMTDLDIVITGAMEADERRRAAEEARGILDRLRATVLLDRLDRAEADDAAWKPAAASAQVTATADTAQGIVR
jgi:hypothetical protein